MPSRTAVERRVDRSSSSRGRLSLKPGDVIDGKYVLRERIGEGGMGRVFLAEQTALGRSVAIKVLEPELIAVPELARKLHDEAMLACHVRSPHCVRVFDCSALPDGTPFIVMEYVPGQPLGQIIANETIPLERALRLFDQILSALSAIHRSGIVHGDVKSDNFLVERVGAADHVTMIDFGLSRVLGSSSDADATNELLICGTPEYMAPEVVGGDAPLPASDLYGAGVILYELLTGTTPFEGGSSYDVMARQVRDPVTPPSQRAADRPIPPEIDRVVLVALDKRPDARYATAAVFAREVAAAAATPGAHATASSPDCSSGLRHDSQAICRDIGAAIRRGDVTAIADGYLELANTLVEHRQLARATSELQEGIDVLTAGGDPRAADTPRCVDRLIIALAALYDDAGDPRHARRLATSTDRSPTWTSGMGSCRSP